MGCGVSETDMTHQVVGSASGSRAQSRTRHIARQIDGGGVLYDTAETQIREIEERVVSKVIEGKIAGTGIKRTPAYETNLIETEFNEARELFWSSAARKRLGTRTQGNCMTWELLKLACEADERTCLSIYSHCASYDYCARYYTSQWRNKNMLWTFRGVVLSANVRYKPAGEVWLGEDSRGCEGDGRDYHSMLFIEL
eukprot:TRINITY_DN4372_c0_g1_i10.p1 TRINITY_DN4372_c0_g1~~TRINITY_DN4372_c0_g1_i10.p1  ORF type:complete len:197 (+),score=0.88 TRINITY_DN4372_c0_g1_i10:165-755(+)